MKKQILHPLLAYCLALLLSGMLSIQYPLYSTFPLGNDTPRHIARAKAVAEASKESLTSGITTALKNSQYPLSVTVLAISGSFLPMPWIQTFMWLMAFAQLSAGVSIAYFLHRAFGWRVGSISLAIWGISVLMAHNYVNGILPHLLSISPMMFFFANVVRLRKIKTAVYAIISYGLHAMSGLFSILTFLVSFIAIAINETLLPEKERRTLYTLTIIVAILGMFSFLLLLYRGQLSAPFRTDAHMVSIPRLLTPYFGPILLLAPLGLFELARNFHRTFHVKILLITFTFISTFLTFSNFVGVALWVRRFELYFLIAVTAMAAIALPKLLREIVRNATAQAILAVVILGTLGLSAWRANARVYSQYEYYNDTRPLPYEMRIMKWMDTELPQNSLIATTRANYKSYWIPVFTQHRWTILETSDPILTSYNDDIIIREVKARRLNYLVLFKQQEQIRTTFHGSKTAFPIVHEDDNVVVVQMLR